jgi:hypothetical protein
VSRGWKKWVLIAVAVAALAAGISIAAVSGGKGHRHPARTLQSRGDLRAAARYLGLPLGTLRRELSEGKTMAQLARGAPGRSAAGLVDAIVTARSAALRPGAATGVRLRRIRARAVVEVQQPFAALARQTTIIAIAARYLGRSVADLRTQRRNGHSLAQLANATSGRSAGGLRQLLVSERRRQIRLAFARGALSAEAERRLLAGVSRRVDAVLTASL